MQILFFNGSPRKDFNTVTMLKHAVAGAKSKGAKVGVINLYDLNYKGCISCFACKTKGGKSYGRCAVKDDLTSIFKAVEKADGLIFASPVYLANITGEMQSFLERLIFPYLQYTWPPQTLFPRQIPTGFIYTMGITEDGAKEFNYTVRFAAVERLLKIIFGPCYQAAYAYDTYQFKDYSKIFAPRFDEKVKAKRRKDIFPKECRGAYKLGVNITATPGNIRR